MNTCYDPKERIYLLLYKKPLSKEEISNEIYGSRNTRVYEYINELYEKDWITIRQDKKDGRRNICYPNSKGIIDNISQNIVFKPVEIKKLNEVFDSDSFKSLMANLDYNVMDFSTINDIVVSIASFSSIYINYLCSKGNSKPSDIRKMLKKGKVKKGFPIEAIKDKMENTFKNIFPFNIPSDKEIHSSQFEGLIWDFMGKFDIELLSKLMFTDISNAIKISTFMSLMIVTADSTEDTLKKHSEKKKANGFRG